ARPDATNGYELWNGDGFQGRTETRRRNSVCRTEDTARNEHQSTRGVFETPHPTSAWQQLWRSGSTGDIRGDFFHFQGWVGRFVGRQLIGRSSSGFGVAECLHSVRSNVQILGAAKVVS